jgi:hypothetical protein
MKILVCGSRDYTDYNRVLKALSEFDNTTIIVHGAARGADTFADIAGRTLKFEIRKYPADWKTYGKSAGPIRNKQMLDSENPDLVLAFSDDFGNSRGTTNMINQSRERGIEVRMFGKQLDELNE